MELDKNLNYIISGLERSGTSMLMQIIKAADIPVAYDTQRIPDKDNPKGYYELEGGKIINKLIEGNFSMDKYKGKFIKITAYGLKYLPPGNYKIIYSERNIEEILDSMEKMASIEDKNREKTRKAFLKLNNLIKNQIEEREDTDVLLVNYNQIINQPEEYIKKILEYLTLPSEVTDDMLKVVDNKLYRQRRMIK